MEDGLVSQCGLSFVDLLEGSVILLSDYDGQFLILLLEVFRFGHCMFVVLYALGQL